MNSFLGALATAARFGRLILVIGLVLGIAVPDLAVALRPWIGELVAGLLFLAALRVGPRQAIGALGDLRTSVGLALLLQTILPVAAVLLFGAIGWSGAIATALVLMMAASPISGSPNLTLLTGNDPAPALRQLVVGTAILPLTIIPVFWLASGLGSPSQVMGASTKLLAIIGVATTGAFALRVLFAHKPAPRALAAFDGLSAIGMAVVVVGLMSAVGPAIHAEPRMFVLVLAVAFAGNFGLQILTALWLKRSGAHHLSAPLGIVAGNRNVALFLAALPAATTDPLLLFIGCYQIPMYLTPILLGRLYRASPNCASSTAH